MNTSAGKKIFEVSYNRINLDYIRIEAARLSENDRFMKYKPNTEKEKKLQNQLFEVIESGVDNFYRPIMDPSFENKEKNNINFLSGHKPAIGKSFNWWKEKLEYSNLRFGTRTEYIAFLGVLIKALVMSGWTLEKAWNAVCNDSSELGNYYNSNGKYGIESTGSRGICGYYDLANTYKILLENNKIWIAGGGYCNNSKKFPLSNIAEYSIAEYVHGIGVPWLVRK